jgi:hypothetical protein
MGVRPDAPTIEAIVPLIFFEIIKFGKALRNSGRPRVDNLSEDD